jgi:hypothetical protein
MLVNVQDELTALFLSAKEGYLPCINALVDNGANVDEVCWVSRQLKLPYTLPYTPPYTLPYRPPRHVAYLFCF